MIHLYLPTDLHTHTIRHTGLCVCKSYKTTAQRRIHNLRLMLLCILILAFALFADAQVLPAAPRHKGLNMKEARAWCDSIALHNPEGIYSCPDLRSIVLIKANRGLKSTFNPGYCEIICIESENINIAPGQVIGYLSPAGDPGTISLTLYDKITHKGLFKPKEYIAKYHASQSTISYERPKKKFRLQFNPLALIPKIGRLIRIVNTPTERNVPTGFRRIYPEPTETGLGSPLFPKYF